MRASPSQGPESEDAPPGRLYLRMIEATVTLGPQPVRYRAARRLRRGALSKSLWKGVWGRTFLSRKVSPATAGPRHANARSSTASLPGQPQNDERSTEKVDGTEKYTGFQGAKDGDQ